MSESSSETLEALKTQIAFYFSRENVAQDAFLVSIMTNEMYVPVEKIAEFKKVQSLTTDLSLLKQAMRESDAVVLSADEANVKPAWELQRNTIILREIPRDTDVDKVKAIFDDPAAGEVKHIRPEMNDNWYVQFADEDVTFSTFMWLRSQTFDGNPIKARIKTESLLQGAPPAPRTAAPAAAAPAATAPAAGAPFMAGAPPANPYAYYVPPQYMPVVAQAGSYAGYGNPYMPPQALVGGQQQPYYANAAPYAHSGTDQTYSARRGGRGRDGRGAKSGKGPGPDGRDARRGGRGGRSGDQGSRRGGRSGERGGKSNKGAARGRGKGDARGRKAPDFELGLTSFPPLPTAKGVEPKPTGYDQEYVKYPRENLVSLIRSFADAVVFQPPELVSVDSPVVIADPNTSLEVEKPVPEIRRRKKNGRGRRRGNDSAASSRGGADRAAAVGERRRAASSADETTAPAADAAPAEAASAPAADAAPAPAPAAESAAPAPAAESAPASAAPPASTAAPAADAPPAEAAAKPAPASPSKKSYADLFKNKA